MSNLLDTVIEAHGGLDRWNQMDAISAHLVQGGALWTIKGQAGVLDDVFARANLHQERESHHPFGAPDRRSSFTPQRVAIETTAGDVIEELDEPPRPERNRLSSSPKTPAGSCSPAATSRKPRLMTRTGFRCSWKPAGRGSSPSATSAAGPSSGLRPQSGKARWRCGSCSNASRPPGAPSQTRPAPTQTAAMP